MRWYSHLCVIAFLVVLPAAAYNIPVSRGPVVPGEWNADFPAVLEKANREHRPMLLVHTSEGCPLCARLNQALDGEAFSQWQQDRKLLMTYVRTSGVDAVYRRTKDFITSVCGKSPGPPYVCIYWPKADGTTNCVAFAGRRGEMGTERKELFSVEFMTAVDQAIKDYLAQDSRHATIEQILTNSVKKISCVKAGAEGSLVMRPESGVLNEGGKVILEARAASDALFVGWEDPQGHFVEWNYRLVVSGRMPAGTYTARFRPKEGCPPPTLTTVTTSLCVQVGQRFKFSVPVDPSCRPVHFRAAQHLPRGVKLDKVSGELTGSFRKEGTVRITILVVGADKANTTKSYSVNLTIVPKKRQSVSTAVVGEKRQEARNERQ